jgi:hypothetical protein
MAAQEAPSIFNDQPLFDCIQNLAKPANSGILSIAFPKDLVQALQQPPNCAISEKWQELGPLNLSDLVKSSQNNENGQSS